MSNRKSFKDLIEKWHNLICCHFSWKKEHGFLNDAHTKHDWNIILNNADPNHDWKNCSNLEQVSGVCSGVVGITWWGRVMDAWLLEERRDWASLRIQPSGNKLSLDREWEVRRFYWALVQENPPVSFKESSLKKDEGLAIFSQGRNLGRKANFLTECNSFVLLLLTPFFVLFKGISWAVNWWMITNSLTPPWRRRASNNNNTCYL